MSSITFIGLFAAVCTTMAFLPQAIKTIKTKSVHDLSLRMYLLQSAGNLSWLVYGLLTKNLPIIIADSVTSIFVITNLVLIIKYKKRTGPQN